MSSPFIILCLAKETTLCKSSVILGCIMKVSPLSREEVDGVVAKGRGGLSKATCQKKIFPQSLYIDIHDSNCYNKGKFSIMNNVQFVFGMVQVFVQNIDKA